MMQNQHLIPELIINLVEQFVKANSENEKFNLEIRLEAIRDYLDKTLKKEKVFIPATKEEKKRYSDSSLKLIGRLGYKS